MELFVITSHIINLHISDQICHKGTKPAFIAYFGIYVLDLDDENQYALLLSCLSISTKIWNLLSSLETAEL
jgi:hypothetical protein